MKTLLTLALGLLVATPALAQDANGAGTRLASTQASAKPGLKKETPAVKKEDATGAAAAGETPAAPPSAPASSAPQGANGAGTRLATSQASTKPGLK